MDSFKKLGEPKFNSIKGVRKENNGDCILGECLSTQFREFYFY